MIVFYNSREEARKKASKRPKWSFIDKGKEAPKGQRWGVRVY